MFDISTKYTVQLNKYKKTGWVVMVKKQIACAVLTIFVALFDYFISRAFLLRLFCTWAVMTVSHYYIPVTWPSGGNTSLHVTKVWTRYMVIHLHKTKFNAEIICISSTPFLKIVNDKVITKRKQIHFKTRLVESSSAV